MTTRLAAIVVFIWMASVALGFGGIAEALKALG